MTHVPRCATPMFTSFATTLLLAQFVVAQSKPAPKNQSPTTIKTQVRQVLLDVVVTDGKSHAITGLNRSDFSITEDGTPQEILSFEPHTSVLPPSQNSLSALDLPPLPQNTFLNISGAREDVPLNVILYDMLNTPLADQPFARHDIQNFLKNKPAGSRYAIFVLSDRLHLLQGVTDDEATLVASMNNQAAGTQSPTFGPPPANTVSPSDFLRESGVVPDHPETMAMLGRLERLSVNSETYLLQRRISITLEAFDGISRYLRGVPGRKNLLWLSGSFPLGVLPGGDPIDPFTRAVDFSPELRKATNQLTLSQVAVYPVDIRGLMVNPNFGAADNRNYSSTSLEKERQAFFEQLAGEHAVLDQIAESSGGRAFYNTNGFVQALQAATEDGSNYYTLSYSPTNTHFAGEMRKIHVHLAQKGCHLSYRRSYFADDDFTLTRRAANAPLEHADAAMERGAPTEHELVFSVHVKAIAVPAPVSPAQKKDLAQFPAFAKLKKWDSVKMQKLALDFSLLQKQMTYLIDSGGVRHGSLSFLYATYDTDSNLLYRSSSFADQTFLPEQSIQSRADTYLAEQILEIPANSAWLRIAVRDAMDGRIGSLEISLPLKPE